MACTPRATQTLFTTSTYSTSSVSTTIFNEVDTITSTALFSTTQCQILNTTTGANPTCLASTVIVSSSLTSVLATTTITQLATVPVLVPQTNPYQTLYSPCPDSPTPIQTTQTTPTTSLTDSSTTSPLSTIIHTQYSTYTDANGVHTASTTISSTVDAAPNTDGGGSIGANAAPLGTIIGGVVGGLVGLLLLSALIWYILWRREQNKFLFDDDDYHGAAGAGGMQGNRPTALLAARNSGGRRNLNLDDEIKGAEAHPYQYGVVGGSPSPNNTPSMGSANATGGGYHSQPSTMGYVHQRNSSRDALMTAHSPPVSPRHLDVPLPGGSTAQQRRASQYTGSSGMTDTVMMANQPPVGMANPTGNDMLGGGGRVSDERDASWIAMGHHPRPFSSLLEAPVISYPPGHGGFYQQYGPIDQVQPQQPQQFQPQLQQQQLQQGPIPAHQALYAAAGLGSQSRTLASPPPGAGGARQYAPSAGMGLAGPSGDTVPSAAAAAAGGSIVPAPTSTSPDVGFGRQRRSGEKARERRATGESGVRSPVIQHLDGGRVPDGAVGPTSISPSPSGSAANTADEHAGDAPPPAYSDP